VATNPATPADVLEEILTDVDQVLVMTVNPGCGHQKFLYSTLAEISRIRSLIDRLKPECDPEVDGGVDEETTRLCIEAGANILVAGSAVFGNNGSKSGAMNRLRMGKE
jgi:ribulose-phosphate 3-epimerase